jgi:hypothetical protein
MQAAFFSAQILGVDRAVKRQALETKARVIRKVITGDNDARRANIGGEEIS